MKPRHCLRDTLLCPNGGLATTICHPWVPKKQVQLPPIDIWETEWIPRSFNRDEADVMMSE
jgi:hypothetical protein